MKNVKLILALFLIASLFGCSSPAKVDNMVYTGGQKTYPDEIKQNLEIATTTGGKETNPLWISEIDNESLQAALQQSLDQQGLLSESGKYSLDVTLVAADQPAFGSDLKVRTVIKYEITEISSARVIFEETISADHTATMGDAFAAVKRLRLANEGSVRTNIEMFLDKLSNLDDKVRLSMLHAK